MSIGSVSTATGPISCRHEILLKACHVGLSTGFRLSSPFLTLSLTPPPLLSSLCSVYVCVSPSAVCRRSPMRVRRFTVAITSCYWVTPSTPSRYITYHSQQPCNQRRHIQVAYYIILYYIIYIFYIYNITYQI
jgi:hypothetical protein